MRLISMRPLAQIENVELNPNTVLLAKMFFGFVEGRSNQVHMGDALEAVRQRASTEHRYDVIIVDCFGDVSGVAASCRSTAFVEGLATLAKGGGRVIQHVWAGDDDIVDIYRKYFAQ